jgi:hypothetical protein
MAEPPAETATNTDDDDDDEKEDLPDATSDQDDDDDEKDNAEKDNTDKNNADTPADDDEEEDIKQAAPRGRRGGRRSTAKKAVPKAAARKRKAKAQDDADTSTGTTPVATEDDEPPSKKRRSKRDRDSSAATVEVDKPKRPKRGGQKKSAKPEDEETEENQDSSPSESEQPDEDDSQSEARSKRSTRGGNTKQPTKQKEEEEKGNKSDDSQSVSEKADEESQPEDDEEVTTASKKRKPATTKGIKRTRATRKSKVPKADDPSSDSDSGSEKQDDESDGAKAAVQKVTKTQVPKQQQQQQQQQRKGTKRQPAKEGADDAEDEGTRRSSRRVASAKNKPNKAPSRRPTKASEDANPSDVSDSDTEQPDEGDFQSEAPGVQAKVSKRASKSRKANQAPKNDEQVDSDASADSELLDDDSDSEMKEKVKMGTRRKGKGRRYRSKAAQAKIGDSSEADSRELDDNSQSSDSNEDSLPSEKRPRRGEKSSKLSKAHLDKGINTDQDDDSKPSRGRNDSSVRKRSGRLVQKGRKGKTHEDNSTNAESDRSNDSASMSDSQNDDAGPNGDSEEDSKRNETRRKSRRRSNPSSDKVDQSVSQAPSGSSVLPTEILEEVKDEKDKGTAINKDPENDASREVRKEEEDKVDRAGEAASVSRKTQEEVQADKEEGQSEEQVENKVSLSGTRDGTNDVEIGAETPVEEVETVAVSSAVSQTNTAQGSGTYTEVKLKKNNDNASKSDFDNAQNESEVCGTKEAAVSRESVLSHQQILPSSKESAEKLQRGPILDDGGMLALLVNVAVDQSREEMGKDPSSVGQVVGPQASQAIDVVPPGKEIAASGDGEALEQTTDVITVGKRMDTGHTASLPAVHAAVATAHEGPISAEKIPIGNEKAPKEAQIDNLYTEESSTRPSDRDLKTNLVAKQNEADAQKGSPETTPHTYEEKVSFGAPSLDKFSGEMPARESGTTDKDSSLAEKAALRQETLQADVVTRDVPSNTAPTKEGQPLAPLNDTVISVQDGDGVINETATGRTGGEKDAGIAGDTVTRSNEVSSLGVLSAAIDLATSPAREHDRGTSGHGKSKEAIMHDKVDASASSTDDIMVAVQHSTETTKMGDTGETKQQGEVVGVDLGESKILHTDESDTTQQEESKSSLLEKSTTGEVQEPSESSMVDENGDAKEADGLEEQRKSEEHEESSKAQENTGTVHPPVEALLDTNVSSGAHQQSALGETFETNEASTSLEQTPDESAAAMKKDNVLTEIDGDSLAVKGTAEPASEQGSQDGKDEQAARRSAAGEPKTGGNVAVLIEPQSVIHPAVLERERIDSDRAAQKDDPKVLSVESSTKEKAEHGQNSPTLHDAADNGHATTHEAIGSTLNSTSENADPMVSVDTDPSTFLQPEMEELSFQGTAIVAESSLTQTSSVEAIREPLNLLGANTRKRHLEEAQDSQKRIKLTTNEPQEIESEEEDIVPEPPISRCPKDRLESLKAQMLKEARRAHGELGATRLFAEYWKYFVLRLEKGGAEEKSKPIVAIKNFLKTKKLRRLHNKLILGMCEFCIGLKFALGLCARSTFRFFPIFAQVF